MVNNKKLFNAALIRYRLGSALVWVGVLSWAPFILLRIAGQRPSPFWFLPFHLFGVIGGSRLRSFARNEMGMQSAKRNFLRAFGHMLIWAGAAVWVPYFYLKLAMGIFVNVMNFLPFHLIGVLGGILTLGMDYFVHKKEY